MAFPILYAEETETIKRYSSINQFKDDFLSTWKQGGWAPIVFDQIDGIGECSGIKSHPVILSFGEDLGYTFPEGKCTYYSDHFIYVDKNGVEYKKLPECQGGKGELYATSIDAFAFVNFDGSSLGIHNRKEIRVGLSYVTADKTLPAVN